MTPAIKTTPGSRLIWNTRERYTQAGYRFSVYAGNQGFCSCIIRRPSRKYRRQVLSPNLLISSDSIAKIFILAPLATMAKPSVNPAVTLLCIKGYSNNCTHMLPNSRRCVPQLCNCPFMNYLPFYDQILLKNVLPLCNFVMRKGIFK